ncbi:MAG: DsbA family protein [Alphaproteobacteria bacterium]|nr:DsbA family protein [Alphaproteobacteria bacterium]
MGPRLLFLSCMAVATVGVALWLAVSGLPDGEGAVRQNSLEERVRRYLIAHPEVLNEAADAFQRRRQREETAARIKVMSELKATLRTTGGLPTLGNPGADVTVVEFFDYRCPYCKQALGELQRLVSEDKNVRLVFREFPILGPDSLVASRAAIAAREQGKYLEMHRALMSHTGALDEKKVMEIAEGHGVDITRLRADMEKPQVMAKIKESLALAGRLGIEATPTLIIGDEVHAGYAEIAILKDLVGRARAGCKSC